MSVNDDFIRGYKYLCIKVFYHGIMDNKLNFRKILAWILFPLTMWYAIGVAFRNFLFSLGILKERTHGVTSIGVGNLCMGGAGKTPFVDYLLKMLQTDYRVANLSRGYGRKTQGFLEADENATTSTIGDEPYMLHKRNPDARVAVCENRNKGIEKLLSLPEPPQIVVLDDAFQHRYVKPTVNILLTEYGKPFFNDFVLPFGDLREPRSGYRRANIIVVTKTPEGINPLEKFAFNAKLKAKPHQQVFFTSIDYQKPVALNDGLPAVELTDFKNILLITGIANPQPLADKLSATATVRHLPFADHHVFFKEDFELIASTFDQLPDEARAIVTTEKDAVRIADNPNYQCIAHLPVYYLPISVKFLDNDGQKFADCLLKTVQENVFYLKKNG